MTRKEIVIAGASSLSVIVHGLRSFVPALAPLDKSAIILVATVLFFISGILRSEGPGDLPWNIVLLFGGAMSIGFCLWQTGAAEWLAIGWLVLFHERPLAGVRHGHDAFFVLVMTNFIMNVAAIAITLPVALVMAPYRGRGARGDHVRLPGGRGHALHAAGRRGAQRHRLREPPVPGPGLLPLRDPATVLLLAVIFVFVWKIWPWMGMPVLLGG